jgi:hypothetical protein
VVFVNGENLEQIGILSAKASSYLGIILTQQQQQRYSAPQNAGGVSMAVGFQKGPPGPPEKKSFKSESQPKPTTNHKQLYIVCC